VNQHRLLVRRSMLKVWGGSSGPLGAEALPRVAVSHHTDLGGRDRAQTEELAGF
jgi:hypothetical protein